MPESFDPSPRSSKRRKTNTYSAECSTASIQDSKAPSVFRSVSDTFSGLSRRLFETKNTKKSSTVEEDSTYGSKEDSLVEDEPIETERNFQTVGAETASGKQQKTVKSRTWNQNREVIATTVSSPRSTRSIESKTGPKTGSNVRGDKMIISRNTPAKLAQGAASRTSQRPRFEVKKADDTISMPGAVVQDHLSQDQTEDGEETIALQRRSSGRERRALRRYSVDLKKASKPKVELSEGILTTSRKGSKVSRKSVMFDNEEKQIVKDLDFQDIDQQAEDLHDEQPRDLNDGTCATDLVVGLDSVMLEEDVLVAERLDAEAEEEALLDDLAPSTPQPGDLLSTDAATVENEAEDDHITAIKSTVLSRLTSCSKATEKLLHLPTQYTTLHALLASTIIAGESNSLLLLGSRGSGKSLLVETALADLTRKHGDDFHIVRLNGFVQTDDKLALREVWRQLGREMKVDEAETNEVSSYAETMASLLGLLAHPEEQLAPNVMAIDGSAGTATAKSVIFILDEFDLFTTHPRQTLLYNLFDIAQARKAPIAVIGCSTRMDVVDCLEKRVKSRFSHRWVHIPNTKSYSGWEEAVATTLCVGEQDEELSVMLEGQAKSRSEREWECRWNEHIKTSFISNPTVQSLLKQVFYSTRSLANIFAALYIPIATLAIPSEHKSQKQTPLWTGTTCFSTGLPSVLALLPSLPVLHLTLLTCATRLESIHALSTLNFNITYSHYLELCARAKLQQNAAGIRIWSREVARGAWEELGAWEVLVPVEGTGGAGLGGKEGGLGGRHEDVEDRCCDRGGGLGGGEERKGCRCPYGGDGGGVGEMV